VTLDEHDLNSPLGIDDDNDEEDEEIEAYCVVCKVKQIMLSPEAVWTN
jgi:hypothetical protein